MAGPTVIGNRFATTTGLGARTAGRRFRARTGRLSRARPVRRRDAKTDHRHPGTGDRRFPATENRRLRGIANRFRARAVGHRMETGDRQRAEAGRHQIVGGNLLTGVGPRTSNGLKAEKTKEATEEARR